MSKPTILVVDDERGVRQSFKMVLGDTFRILEAGDGASAMTVFNASAVDLVLLDVLLPDVNGMDLIEQMTAADPQVVVIMVTAVNDVQSAVKAIKRGAAEYIIKPFEVEAVVAAIDTALEKKRLKKEVVYLRNELQRVQPFEAMVGQDPLMRTVFDLIATISTSTGSVLITGESGTGKELVARAIHNRSPRRGQPFVVINCAAIPSALMESELFGYAKGAFTGATATRLGKLEIADSGTIFLDDIDTLDINMQAKLLRIIQEKECERLGSNKVITVDVRFVAATNKDLPTLIAQGRFREDLYYRLNVFPIQLPALRERRGDIPILLDHFLAINARNTGAPVKRFSKGAVESLMTYDWPGNIRELQNLVERLATITSGQVIHQSDLFPVKSDPKDTQGMTLREAVGLFERRFIADVLDQVNGNRQDAARRLGIHRNTLLSKINELGLKPQKRP